MQVDHNLYIHVPFCLSKCKYCAFYSVVCSMPDWESYCNGICSELNTWGNKLGKIKIPTIFFGGGTPSLLPLNIFERIMKCIKYNFLLDNNCEITLEANPGTLDNIKLKEFLEFGINRLSVGVQSLKNDELLFLGRCHDAVTAINLLMSAQNLGLKVSADFIYGLPTHTVDSVKELCKQINKLQLKHVSLYELTIEKNTPFGRQNLKMPTNDQLADMYIAINDNLNLSRYEVSNYSVCGQECMHNKNIWAGQPYIGIGKAAAGRVYMDGIWYEQLGNNELFECMSFHDRAVEKIITGMRTSVGVLLSDEVKECLNWNFITKNSNLLHVDTQHICATNKGLLILDEIIEQMVK